MNCTSTALAIKKPTRVVVVAVIQQVADQLFRPLPEIVVNDWPALFDTRLALAVTHRNFYQETLATLAASATTSNAVLSFKTDLARVGVVISIFIELVLLDVHG